MNALDYKQCILDLNYCLFSQMAATTLVQDSCISFMNPRNPGHQQSNLYCRLRFSDETKFISFVNESVERFYKLGLQPRYSIDELATPSLATLTRWFENLGRRDSGFNLEYDTDIIMACSFEHFQTMFQKKRPENIGPAPIKATLRDVEDLTQLIGTSFGYGSGDDLNWLRYKLTSQIKDHQTSIYAIEATTEVLHQQQTNTRFHSVTILNSPDGLPHLMHVNLCGTHPTHQRKGLALSCLEYALHEELKCGQTAYLEVYSDIKHAQRMYERVGFTVQGTLDYLTATHSLR